jgi:hypothetical protein
MPTFTLETPRGRRLKIEAQNDADAVALADRWDLEDHAATEAQRIGVSPDLILRQMNVESRGNPKAVSPKGARGPMQLMPGTAKELGVNADDPYENVTGGVTYLKRQLDAFGGDEAKALAAYNAGPGAVRKAGGVPKFPETQMYVRTLANKSPPAGPVSARAAPVAAKPKSDELLGFEKGAMTPLDNASGWLEGGVNALGGVFGRPSLGADLSHMAGMPSATEAKAQHAGAAQAAAARGVVPGKLGEFAGNVAGTLPTAMLPGGILAQGAASGALLSNAKDGAGLARDAAIGAAGAKAGDVVLRGVGGAIGKALRPKTMNPAEITAAKDAAYKTVDGLGVQYKAAPFRGLVSVMGDEVRAAPMYDPLGHTKVNSALAKIQSMSGKSPTFGEVENLRKFVRMNVVDGAGSDAERAVGNVMLRQVDEFLDAMRPTHMVQPGGAMSKFGVGPRSADPQAAVQAVKSARDLARRDFLTKDVMKGVESAELATSRSGIGGNLDNNLRGEMKKLLANNPNLKPDEKAALQAAVKGSISQNALRIIGKLSPTSGALANFLSLGVGVGTGNPLVPVAMAGTGFAAKTAADVMTKGRVNNVLSVIAAGGSKPAQPIIAGALRKAAPVTAGLGAAGAATMAHAATKPTLEAEWPPTAVLQDAKGNFYDAQGRHIR